MTFELTDAEKQLLVLVLRKCKTKDDEITLDFLAKNYKIQPKKAIYHQRTERHERNNIKQRMRIFIMKMAALGIKMERKSRLGVSSPATYGFATAAAIVKAEALLEQAKEEAVA